MEVSVEAENNIISPLSYEDFNINGFGYSNYVDLYGAGNGYEDVERISIMTTNVRHILNTPIKCHQTQKLRVV